MSKHVFKKLPPLKMDTVRSTEKVINQIHKLLDDLEVDDLERQCPTESLSGKAKLQFVLRFEEDGEEYFAYIQKVSVNQKNMANNLAAIHLWLQSRCNNIRRGVEGPAEAFGAHLVEGSSVPPSWREHLLMHRMDRLLPEK